MPMVKKIVIAICSMILVSFTFIGSGVEQDVFSVHYNKTGVEEQTQRISGHEKKAMQMVDSSREETQTLWKTMKSSKVKLIRSAVLLVFYFLTVCLLASKVDRLWACLSFYRSEVFYIIRFRYEMIIQKEKDGKKKYGFPDSLGFKQVKILEKV